MTQQKRSKNKAAEQMRFIGDFDTELTTDEKLEAAAKLDDLVQSTLFRFPEYAYNFDHNIVVPNGFSSSVLLRIPQGDGTSISFSVDSSSLDDGTEKRSISIQEIRGYRGGISHLYYIEDDQVLRYDRPEQSVWPHIEPADISVEGIRRKINILKNEIENSKLEQQMGLNRQPVGIDEINKLAELLESAQPKPRL